MKILAALVILALALAARAQEPELFPDTRLNKPNYFNDGVVLVYVKGTKPVDDHRVSVALQDTVIVRVRNLDGWLIRRLENRQITGEPVMTPAQRDNFLELQAMKKTLRLGSAQDFLKHYEDTAPKKADTAPNPPPAPPEPWPVLSETKIADLRASHNAYRALLDYTKRRLYLIINSSHLRGLESDNPEAGEVNRRAAGNPDDTLHEFAFRLRRFDKDREEWGKLYDGTRGEVDVRVNLGVDFAGQLFTLDSAVHPLAANKVQRVCLELYSTTWLRSVLGGMVILFGFLVLMGKNTDLLRDRDLNARADGRAQFSLARIQLAFWLYLVVGAFLIIWLVTDRLDTLNASVLALLGISSGTLLASKLANTFTLTDGQVPADPLRVARAGKSYDTLTTELTTHRRELEREARRIEPNPDHLEASAYEEARRKLEYRLEQTDTDLAYLRHSVFSRFFVDLLSENGRLSLHRLQIVVWTVVLGVVFVARVRRELAMPEFSDTLLGLMGLSSVTYVALKVPELKKTEAQAKANRADPPAG
jgi:hypothetical protein